MHRSTLRLAFFALTVLWGIPAAAAVQADDTTLRVFIFAGQSNMVGSDSKVADIHKASEDARVLSHGGGRGGKAWRCRTIWRFPYDGYLS